VKTRQGDATRAQSPGTTTPASRSRPYRLAWNRSFVSEECLPRNHSTPRSHRAQTSHASRRGVADAGHLCARPVRRSDLTGTGVTASLCLHPYGVGPSISQEVLRCYFTRRGSSLIRARKRSDGVSRSSRSGSRPRVRIQRLLEFRGRFGRRRDHRSGQRDHVRPSDSAVPALVAILHHPDPPSRGSRGDRRRGSRRPRFDRQLAHGSSTGPFGAGSGCWGVVPSGGRPPATLARLSRTRMNSGRQVRERLPAPLQPTTSSNHALTTSTTSSCAFKGLVREIPKRARADDDELELYNAEIARVRDRLADVIGTGGRAPRRLSDDRQSKIGSGRHFVGSAASRS
jgi:hypothetical protein